MPAPTTTLHTERLLLRPWRPTDLPLFAALNADPEVMKYFPAPLTLEQSNSSAERIIAKFREQGWGLWAVEALGVADFIGLIGLNRVEFSAHFTPAVEVGWRLAAPFWGRGYATEGARRALRFGFEVLGEEQIVSFTVPDNVRSRRVMERLGMHRNPGDDFDHPKLAEGDPLRRHVLYRIRRSEFKF